jgi:hypothetical protein
MYRVSHKSVNTNGLSYAPVSQFIVGGVKLHEMRHMGATAAILDPALG